VGTELETEVFPGVKHRISLRRELRLGGFFFSTLRRRVRLERDQQTARDASDSLDRSLERSFVFLRRLAKTADPSHKLKRSSSSLFVSDRWIEIEQRLDIPAHECSPWENWVLMGWQSRDLHKRPALAGGLIAITA
jgi:hypothetical protein